IAIRVYWCRPIRKEEIASWDGGKSTWGGQVRVFGTVPGCFGRKNGLGVLFGLLGFRGLAANIPLRKRARFTTPTGGYEVGESSVAAAARHISPALTIADRRRADDRLISRLRRERRYFCTLSTTYA
nr:hypothetical protein [Tanacetum cinerariifolium]